MKKGYVTLGIVATCLVVVWLSFISFTNGFSGIKITNKEKLDVNSETVLALQDILLNGDDLRKAYLSNETITDKEILEYILSNLEDNEYKVKTVIPEKIMCNVTSDIFFISDGVCKVEIISNDKIKEYEKKIFGIDREVKYEEINYHGLNCKNDGQKYYCLVSDYLDTYKTYSLVDKAYIKNDEIYLYEYYLKINLADSTDCNKYYNKTYCDNYLTESTPDIASDIVQEDGVYYKHTFKKNEFNLYSLINSEIVVK